MSNLTDLRDILEEAATGSDQDPETAHKDADNALVELVAALVTRIPKEDEQTIVWQALDAYARVGKWYA